MSVSTSLLPQETRCVFLDKHFPIRVLVRGCQDSDISGFAIDFFANFALVSPNSYETQIMKMHSRLIIPLLNRDEAFVQSRHVLLYPFQEITRTDYVFLPLNNVNSIVLFSFQPQGEQTNYDILQPVSIREGREYQLEINCATKTVRIVDIVVRGLELYLNGTIMEQVLNYESRIPKSLSFAWVRDVPAIPIIVQKQLAYIEKVDGIFKEVFAAGTLKACLEALLRVIGGEFIDTIILKYLDQLSVPSDSVKEMEKLALELSHQIVSSILREP